VRPKDAGALASAIGYLLDHPEEAACMANAARTRARQAFAWEGFVDAYDALYRQAVTDG
jgi:glycosyltransferase involved in cell wall biosynthesis